VELIMALNKNHQAKIDLMNAFDMADRNPPRDELGRARYGMGSGGLPRTPAQQASVKKDAKVSALKRGERAALRAPNTSVPGVAVGSGIGKKPKGILL